MVVISNAAIYSRELWHGQCKSTLVECEMLLDASGDAGAKDDLVTFA